MKYRAIIFDFDDTLVESRLKKWAQHKLVSKKFYNIDLSYEMIREHWGKPFNELLGLLYKNGDTYENMHKAIRSVHNQFLKDPYEHANRVVDTILKKGIEVGVLSAALREHLNEELERAGFPVPKFFALQGADETEVHKPDPRVFDLILAKLSEKGVSRNEVLYVGDSLLDLQAAKGAGLHFIAVTTGLYSRNDFLAEGAETVIDDVKDLLDFI